MASRLGSQCVPLLENVSTRLLVMAQPTPREDSRKHMRVTAALDPTATTIANSQAQLHIRLNKRCFAKMCINLQNSIKYTQDNLNLYSENTSIIICER